jgi:hypothetical protein
MQRFERDPQSELVRRYARILRSAPAEATRFATGDRVLRAGTGAGGPGVGAAARDAAAPARHTPAAGENTPARA